MHFLWEILIEKTRNFVFLMVPRKLNTQLLSPSRNYNISWIFIFWALFERYLFPRPDYCRSRLREYKWWGPRITCIRSACAWDDQVIPGVWRTKTEIWKTENQRDKQRSVQQKNQGTLYFHKSQIPCIFCSCLHIWSKSKLLHLRAWMSQCTCDSGCLFHSIKKDETWVKQKIQVLLKVS